MGTFKQVKFVVKNTQSSTSKITLFIVFGSFVLFFIFKEWHFIAVLYLFLFGFVIFLQTLETRVAEVTISEGRVRFRYKRAFKFFEEEYAIETLSVTKERNPAFKFSEVSNLVVKAGKKRTYLLKGGYEFDTDDINDLYVLLNRTGYEEQCN